MAREWWKDPDIMGPIGQLAKVDPMASNMSSPTIRNAQGVAPAGTVEEGEYVMDKPIVDKLGPEALDSLREKVRTGNLDKDKLNHILAGGGSPSYRGGGLVKRYQLGGLVTKKNDQGQLSGGGRHLNVSNVGSAPPDTGAGLAGFSFGADYETRDSGFGGALPGTQNQNFTQQQIGRQVGSLVGSGAGAGIGVAGDQQFDLSGVDIDTGDDITETAEVVDTTPPQIPSTEERYRGIGMGGLADIAAGEHPLFRTLANMAQQQIATQGAMDTAALRQQMAQMGVTGGSANAMLADLQRDVGSQMAGAAAETAVNAQSMAMKASEALATKGLEGMQFEYRQNQNALNDLLEAGDLNGYAQAFENLYGMPVDTTALADEQLMGKLTSGMQTVTTLMATNPNITWDDPLMQTALGSVWAGMGKTGPVDSAWATKFVGDMKLAGDPMYQLLGGVTQEGANEFFGEDFVNDFTYTDANGNTMTGWPALRKELGRIKLSGGFYYDSEKGWVFDDTNPLVQNLFGKFSDVTEPETPEPAPLLTTAEGEQYMVGDDGFITVDGEKVMFGDNFIKQNNASPTGLSAGGQIVDLNPETGTPRLVTYARFRGDNPNTNLNQDQFIQFLSQEPASLDIINDWIAGPLGPQITASVTGILGGKSVHGHMARTTSTLRILADIKPKIDAFLKDAGVSEAAKTIIMQNIEAPLKKEIEDRI